MPCLRNCESLSGSARSRRMLHAVKKTFGNSTPVDVLLFLVVLKFSLCGSFSSWRTQSSIMMEEKRCVFRLPELKCSCRMPWLLLLPWRQGPASPGTGSSVTFNPWQGAAGFNLRDPRHSHTANAVCVKCFQIESYNTRQPCRESFLPAGV